MKIALVSLGMNEADPPLGLAYLASYARKYGKFDNIVIVDREEPLGRLCKEKPDIVGVSAMTHEFLSAKNLAEKIKNEFGIPAIIGGHHISMLPNHFADSKFDVAIIGEGEQTMLELMQLYEKKGSFEPDDLKKIKGIEFRDGKRIVLTEKRQLIENLDSIPYPARDLLKMKEFYINLKSICTQFGTYAQMLTSRGCPYKCTFCSTSAFWSKARFHSANYVVGEMKELYENYRMDGIMIYDDLFIADRKRIEEIVRLMKQEGLYKKLYFYISARANLIDSKMCGLLKEMNVKQAGFGLESGSEKILRYLKGGNVTAEQNRNAIRLCKEAGIKTRGYFIIGSPGETEEDLKQTLSLVQDKNLDQANIFQITPYPGTQIWEYAKKKGIVSDSPDFDIDKIYMSGFKESLVMNDNISPQRLKEWYDLFQAEVRKKMKTGALSSLMNIRPKHLKYILTLDFMKKVSNVMFR